MILHTVFLCQRKKRLGNLTSPAFVAQSITCVSAVVINVKEELKNSSNLIISVKSIKSNSPSESDWESLHNCFHNHCLSKGDGRRVVGPVSHQVHNVLDDCTYHLVYQSPKYDDYVAKGVGKLAKPSRHR